MGMSRKEESGGIEEREEGKGDNTLCAEERGERVEEAAWRKVNRRRAIEMREGEENGE